MQARQRETAGAESSTPAVAIPRRVGLKRPSDRFFQFLGSAEGDLLGSLDLDRLAGRRVAAHTGGAPAHLQNAEAADADALAFLQVLDDGFDEIAEHGLRLLLRHLMRLRECGGEML